MLSAFHLGETQGTGKGHKVIHEGSRFCDIMLIGCPTGAKFCLSCVIYFPCYAKPFHAWHRCVFLLAFKIALSAYEGHAIVPSADYHAYIIRMQDAWLQAVNADNLQSISPKQSMTWSSVLSLPQPAAEEGIALCSRRLKRFYEGVLARVRSVYYSSVCCL